MDNTLTAGQLVQIIDNLECPHGLCPSSAPDKILVADSHTVKEIDINNKLVTVVAKGFKMAFDVAVSSSGVIGVSDVQANKIVLMKRTDNDIFQINTSVGSGEAGCSDDPASKAQLLEPTGLCFDFNTLLFCCFGGKNNGYVRVYTTLKFAYIVFMAKIRQIYDTIGFLEKTEHNRVARAGGYNRIEYAEGLQWLLDSLSYLENFIKQRRAFLNTAPAGPEGTMYHISVKGFAETVLSLQKHLKALESAGLGDMVPSLNLYAFTNESRKEHGFAKHKQSGQYRHPTKQQYCHSKGSHEIELIKKKHANAHIPITQTHLVHINQPTFRKPFLTKSGKNKYRKSYSKR
ncbi:Hypothetical predicted protein [Paramuricea clavata]|uniref:Uncharacterized protein n=1 Tax=Paramuricea clavata TaxID=317549 RepID=A0A6S7HWP2_PARCT|nr:Hypothetical predicted protein [Paramuricea clavata]